MTSENIVNFEDWEKLDLRVAKIVKVEEIDNNYFIDLKKYLWGTKNGSPSNSVIVQDPDQR